MHVLLTSFVAASVLCVAFSCQQKNDVSQAVAKYDQFDFLIDIVPRDEIKPAKRVKTLDVFMHQKPASRCIFTVDLSLC